MFIKRLMKLFLTMAFRALAKQIQVSTTRFVNPIYGSMSIDKSQHLYPIEHTCTTCPATNIANSIFLAIRHTCRSHLYPIDIDILQQSTGYHELLVRHETNTAGLFTIAQCRVHDFDGSYLFSSHALILS